MLSEIGTSIALAPELRGLAVSATQIGYVFGLILLVPLADHIENRLLVAGSLVANVLALIYVAISSDSTQFVIGAGLLGVSSATIQILVPLATHFAAPERRGRVVGLVMAGLLLGILLSRPIAAFVASRFGWRDLYFGSALCVSVVAIILILLIPARRPTPRHSYLYGIRAYLSLLREHPTLRRRAARQALLFGSFNLFWTAVPIWLVSGYGLTLDGVAAFALAGAGGAFIAPLAGRWADRGLARAVSIGASLATACMFILSAFSIPVWVLAICAIVIDAGVQANLVVSQREIYALDPARRGAINSVFMAILFGGGAICSYIAPVLASVSWSGIATIGAVLAMLACASLFSETSKK
ncbi:MFS transporter [Bradyrhizobium sp. Ash2021]|uniref:MFS transporter n=1 Tax=Bradyrhizobium sp. Ash2021 TaxID=2954771 RepID=UPI002814BFAD|nr:MFS transporter [Bradyrhizobium sp. Ash2021]WMT79410.1 MFS transporter [Bradyrhizobium sp. Ash2021]